MKRVIIVQARMTSTRLPGKVLMDVAGRPMLSQQLRRLKRCTSADEIVVATTTNTTDDPVIEVARQEAVSWFRGSEHDVLSRYVGAAIQSSGDVIVRVTADCPLIDPTVTDRVIGELVERRFTCDYASNVIERTYPKGLDVEAFFLDTLLRTNRLAQTGSAREHVTPTVHCDRPELFLLHSVTDTQNNADLRWTVDYPADLELIRNLYRTLELETNRIGHHDIAMWMRDHPDVLSINAGVG